MLGVFVLGSNLLNIKIVHGDVETTLQKNLGEDFGKVLSYEWVELFSDLKIVKLEEYSIPQSDIPVVDSSDEKKGFEEIVDKVIGYRYDASQSDPNKLFTEGGNCQAVSLYLYDTFAKNGYDVGLVLEPGHMYNWVKVDGKMWKVDLVKNKVEAI